MEFLQLRYFYESAHSGSFAKTAQKYMVPASSVSASVKRLERELGCRLFERTANRIVPNENGVQLMRSLAVVFGELEGALERLGSADADTREVRILVKALRAPLTDRVIAYKTAHADAKFQLAVHPDAEGLSDYDIIVDTEKDCYEGLERFALCRQRVHIYAAKSSPLRARTLTLSQLRDQPFATMSPQGNQYKILMRACAAAGFTPKTVAQINDAACFFRLIASGVAIGVAGEQSAREEGGTVALDICDFEEYQTVYVYYKKENAWGSVGRFIKFLRASVKE